jgi:rhodanese-related sulfurtransferase
MIISLSRYTVIPVFSLALILSSHATSASEYTSPAAIDGAVTIDAEQLIELLGSRAELVLIDSRIHEDYTDGYIEGSLHLVDRETNCESLARVLPGMETPVIFYCNGVKCDRSDRAAVIAIGCGYREVYWFRGGIEEWRASKYPLIQ